MASLLESRQALRRMLRHPASSAVVVLTLAVAAGPLTIALGLLRQPELSTSGLLAPQELIRIVGSIGGSATEPAARTAVTYPEFTALRRSLRTVSGLAATLRFTAELDWGDAHRTVPAALVSDEYFDVLGVDMTIGRPFRADKAGSNLGEPVAVLSRELWRSDFAADPDVIGRTVRVNGATVRIVGVAGKHFAGLEPRVPESLWLPAYARPFLSADLPALDERDAPVFDVVGRPQRGLGLAQVQTEVASIGREVAMEQPRGAGERRFNAEPLSNRHRPRSDEAVNALTIAMWILAAALLGVACFNIAGVFLVRAMSEEHDTAVRLALGSGHRRLVREALMESAGVAALGLAGAWIGGTWLLAVIRSKSDDTIVGSLDWHAFGWVALAAAVITFTLVALPATYWRTLDVSAALTTGGRTESRRSRDSRSVLVAAQVTLLFVVAMAAATMGRSIQQLRRVDPGFSAKNLLSVSYDLRHRATTRSAFTALKIGLSRAAQDVPGVQAAGIGQLPLLYNAASPTNLIASSSRDVQPQAYDVVGPGYFAALGVRLVEGRDFEPQDGVSTEQRVIVNQSLARKLWGRLSPIGEEVQWLRTDGSRIPARVVGVVQDFMSNYVARQPGPRLFWCALQGSAIVGYLYVRVDPRLAGASRIRAAIAGYLGGNAAAVTVQSVEGMREDSMRFLKNTFLVAFVLAGLAVLMAAVGLFSMLSYTVARRTREFGIRLALGSPRGRILWLVLAEGLRAAAAGVLLAIPLGAVVIQMMRITVYKSGALDPFVLAATGLLLLVVVVGGSLWPALLAIRVNPMDSIRST